MSQHPNLIFIDDSAALGIAKQILLSIFSTNILNRSLIWASKNLQRLNIEIRHELSKLYIVPDILSKQASIYSDVKPILMERELDVLFTVSLVQIELAFNVTILDGYKSDLN